VCASYDAQILLPNFNVVVVVMVLRKSYSRTCRQAETASTDGGFFPKLRKLSNDVSEASKL
jgi:hypothetical protein